MTRRTDIATVVLLVVLAANAAILPFFRFFLTLDGPMHVLHACVLKSQWFSGRYATPAVDYWVTFEALDMGDLLLLPITWVFPPLKAHAVFGSLVLLVLGMGVLSVARGPSRADPAVLLWILPLSCSFCFIMGFFTFLLACGLALMCLGWWMRRATITGRTLLFALLWVALCQATHRSGGALVGLFIGCHEGTLWFTGRAAWRARWAGVHPAARKVLLSAVALATAYKVVSIVLLQPRVHIPGEGGLFQGLFSLRPLLLFAHEQEAPFLLALGIPLLLTIGMGVVHRILAGRRSLWGDVLVVIALLLFAASVVARTPNAHLLYLGTRLQTVGLLLIVAWAATVIPTSRWTLALGVAVLAAHSWRMIYVERVMAGSLPTYQRAMEVVEHLPSHGVALSIVRDDNWMHEHLSAFVAASYEGVFFSSGDHLAFRHHRARLGTQDPISFGFPPHLRWLEAHVSEAASPVIDHVVIFGHGMPDDLRIRNARDVLHRHYLLQWSNDYAEVWVRDPNE